jgi:hypothetical protein
MSVSPFRYPAAPHVRRHGPVGYSTYRHYRPWLRDEFCFRCVYCLRRETWAFHDSDFELDHDVAQSIATELCRDYTNLVYACHNCNKRKGNRRLPSPSEVGYGVCMEVVMSGKDVGEIHPLNDDGIRLIDELSLDAPKITATRRRYIGMFKSLEKNDRPSLLLWMGFPEDLPNLLEVAPQPEGNLLPNGIHHSWHALKARNELPDIYE